MLLIELSLVSEISEVLEKPNYTTISKLFYKTFFSMWPNGFKHDDVIIFVTNVVPNMVNVANLFKDSILK